MDEQHPSDDPIKAMLSEGRLEPALKAAQALVREQPASARHRTLLFQLLSLSGQWQRALTQLNVAAELDPQVLLMAQACRATLECEALRAEVFAGKRQPMVLGEPQEWVGWLIQANQLSAEGKYADSRRLRERAFDAAPASTGSIDGRSFEWIADADMRLGPVLEAIVDGRYLWVPMSNIRQIVLDPPADLRDLVWAPARFTWGNGGSAVGFIPTRYSGTERCADALLQLARKTVWETRADDCTVGLGQRLFATDEAEAPLLDTRQIVFGAPEAAAEMPGRNREETAHA